MAGNTHVAYAARKRRRVKACIEHYEMHERQYHPGLSLERFSNCELAARRTRARGSCLFFIATQIIMSNLRGEAL